MFTRCIFCHASFPANGVFGRLPPGRRIAFDPEHGHLWVVCQSCHRWNLCPIEERFEALYELERQVRDEARIVAETDNVTLLTTGELVLIRLGPAGLAEQAWWRYGRELHKRRARFYSTRSQLVAYTYGAMQYVGELVGLGDEDLNISWDDTPVADVLRWRRFGWSAWRGRVNCPFCGSSLRALRYDVSWWVYPRRDEDGRTIVEVPCTRCDPWTPDQVYQIKGAEAENVLRRVLAYQHISGATERSIKDATRIIESVGGGSTEGALERFSTGEKSSLWGMGKAHSMALEIALNDSVERRMMRAELRSLEIVWKREEELARIIDEELTSKSLFERHLGRLPISVRRAREKVMSASRRNP